MALYETSKSRLPASNVGAGVHRQLVTDVAIVAVQTAMIDNANDDTGLLWLPAGAVIVDARLSGTDMDTGSAALVWDIGDADDEDRIFAASTVGQTGSTSTNAIAYSAHLHKYTTRTQIRAYCKTAAATAAAGTLKFSITYFVDPDFNTTPLVAST
jgi:hypothetical protein